MNPAAQAQVFATRRAHAERLTSAQKRYREDHYARMDRDAATGKRPHMRTFAMAFAFADAVQKVWDDATPGDKFPPLYLIVTEKLRGMS